MRPVLFHLRGIPIHSYPALLYVGLTAGITAGNLAAHAAGLDAYRVFWATCLLLVPALIGARLLYVTTHWALYRRSLRRIWNRREGGAALYGGILVALPLSALVIPRLQLPWGRFWDVAVFTMLIAMAIARVGCLLNGCCAGRRATGLLAMYLPNQSGAWEKRLPTPFLEAAWACVLLLLAIALRPRMPFAGALFWMVAGGYAAGRLVLESTRERQPGTPRITIHHSISGALLLLSCGCLAAGWPNP
jgi:phosphatidylglycerol---prolipoprotein diacylglyceryl transferase